MAETWDVIVVGGGRIGFYLTKELLAEGHEIVLMEKDPRSAERIRDELGAVVVKLLLVDLSGTGTVTRIVSFIGVGVLMLVYVKL